MVGFFVPFGSSVENVVNKLLDPLVVVWLIEELGFVVFIANVVFRELVVFMICTIYVVCSTVVGLLDKYFDAVRVVGAFVDEESAIFVSVVD